MRNWLVRAAVSLVAVAILLTFVPVAAVIGALGHLSAPTWGAALAIFFLGHCINAVKFRLLLGADAATLSTCIEAQYAGLVANLGLPGLAGGDVVRAAYLAPTAGTRRVIVASVADRAVDTLTLVVLVAVALPFAGTPPAIADLIRRGGVWIAAGIVAAALLVGAGFALGRRARVVSKVVQAWMALGTRPAALVAAATLSLIVQTSFVLTSAWLGRGVGVGTAVSIWFVAWPLSKLVAVLPVSLGGIGVREAALVSLMAPYGAPREAVLAAGLLWQSVLIVSGIVGFIVTQLVRRTTPLTTPSSAPAAPAARTARLPEVSTEDA